MTENCKIPDAFKVKECTNESEISFGIAANTEDQVGRLDVLTQRYTSEKYLKDIPQLKVDISAEDTINNDGISLLEQNLHPNEFMNFLKMGSLFIFNDHPYPLYLDHHYWQSIPFVAKTKDSYVGSARLIMYPTDSISIGYPLPTLSQTEITIFPEWEDRVKDVNSELSQLAKTKDSSATVSIGLLRTVTQYSKMNGIKEWIATIDNTIIKLFNGVFFRFNIPKIGPSAEYLGSESTPILIVIDECIANAKTGEASKQMAEFLEGKTIVGDEWYIGV